jgi:DNA-directed RNA polymerase specialized sigma24 family protein
METDSPPMPHAADLDDAQLLANNDIGGLLARYDSVIRNRCIARLHGSLDAEDVAQDVRERLLAEFSRGKRYGGLPYRVVVHQVIGWTIADHFAGRPTDVPLPEGWAPVESEDPASEVVSRGWVEWVVAQVDGKDGQIIAMRYRDLLEPAEIAERLGMEPNAVHQAIFRGLRKIRGIEHA